MGNFMKRILLIAAILLLVTPAFAAVTINVTQGAGADVNKLTVSYTTTGEAVRAFALDFTFTNGGNPAMTFSNIADFNRGESNKPGGGYGIFPGRFRNFIDPGNPNWYQENYIPVAPPNDIDSNGTGMGESKFIAELGTLYKDANAPGPSGTLFTVRIDPNGGQSYSNLAVTVNTIRGGVVLEDGTSVAPTINIWPPFPPQPPTTLTYPAADGNNGRYQVNWSAGVNADGYKLARSSDGGSTWSTIYTGTATTVCDDVNTGAYKYRVCSTKVGWADSAWTTGAGNCAVVLCFPTSEPNMTTWKALGKPRCWCYARQCKGDGDGALAAGGSTKIGYWYVGTADLTAFTKAYLVLEPTSGKGPGLQGEPNVCYDIDHTMAAGGSTKVGYWRVGTADLSAFTKAYLVLEPTKGLGIGTCPAGASGSRYTLPTDYKPCN
jgi:predicted small secreted protein